MCWHLLFVILAPVMVVYLQGYLPPSTPQVNAFSTSLFPPKIKERTSFLTARQGFMHTLEPPNDFLLQWNTLFWSPWIVDFTITKMNLHGLKRLPVYTCTNNWYSAKWTGSSPTMQHLNCTKRFKTAASFFYKGLVHLCPQAPPPKNRKVPSHTLQTFLYAVSQHTM